MQSQLKIVVVEEDPDRAREIIDGLTDGGWQDIHVVAEISSLERRMAQIMPDIVLINISNPGRDVLEHLSLVSGAEKRPVAMFVDRSDPATTKAAIEAGLSAYVVGGLQKERVRPVLDTAIARFHMVARMRAELAAAKAALAERKTLDRAKGLLMKARGMTEEEAYALLRKTAMDQGRKMIDVATALVTAAELLR